MTTAQESAAPVTLRASTAEAEGLVSFTICRAQPAEVESLNELLALLAALSGGVLSVVQQHMPGAVIEVAVHRESMVNHYVLGEVFNRAKPARTAEINPK